METVTIHINLQPCVLCRILHARFSIAQAAFHINLYPNIALVIDCVIFIDLHLFIVCQILLV